MKTCPNCGRESFLWGGESCDVCDADSDGINDRDEPIGIGPILGHSLFHAEDKGFEVVDAGRLQISVGEWPVHLTRKQEASYLLVLRAVGRRYRVLGISRDGTGALG